MQRLAALALLGVCVLWGSTLVVYR
jgi:hypothetical protein